jgi:hypothetical protein
MKFLSEILKKYKFPIVGVNFKIIKKEIRSDFILYVTKPGQALVGWEYAKNSNLNELKKFSDFKSQELRITLAIAKSRNYKYYTYPHRSKCNCLALRNVTNRTCRLCEFVKRSKDDYLQHRKETERGSEEQRLKNNKELKQKYPFRTKRWRLSKDAFGEQNGKIKTKEINKAYALNNPEVIKLIRIRTNESKFLATPTWADSYEILKIEDKTIKLNAAGTDTDTDHYLPLRGAIGTGRHTLHIVCGLHCESNLRSIDRLINIKKSNTIPEEYSNHYSNDDFDYLRQKAIEQGLTENGSLQDDERKKLYLEKKRKHPDLLKVSKNRGRSRNRYSQS